MRAQDFLSFHEASRRNGIILSFGGDLSENVLFSLGEVLKLRMQQGAADAAVSVIRVPPDAPDSRMISAGMIVVGLENGRFFVACGNEVPDEQVVPLRAKLDHLAGLSSDELRTYYREKLRQTADEGSLGGSIGLIEIARRSSAPVEYDFQARGAGRSFFCLKAFI